MPKFSNPFADVKIMPIEIGGKEEDSKIAICVKDDDGEYQSVGIRASTYNLITNERAKDTADDIMSRSGHQWKSMKTLWDGRKFVQYYITEDAITEFVTHGGAQREKKIHLGLMLRNSYDGTSAFGQEIFACDIECMNQFVSRRRFGYFTIYHNDKNEFLVEDAVQNLSLGMQKVISIAPRLEELSRSEIGYSDIIESHKQTSIPDSMWGKVIARLALEEATRFGLYSAMTYVASHNMKGFNQISIGNTITDYFIQPVLGEDNPHE